MSIDKLLQNIEEIDGSLQAILDQRAKILLEIAKIDSGQHVPGVESDAARLATFHERNAGRYPNESLDRIFREIFSASRALAAQIKVAYLGPEGTYSQDAVFTHFGHSVDAVPEVSIPGIFAAVEHGRAHFGVVPVENSTEGTVNHTLDLLTDTQLRICGEVRVRIRHCLLGSDVTRASIQAVHAHPQSLAQCRRWLDEHLPQAERVPSSSNAAAAAHVVGKPELAAIAGDTAAQTYGLRVLDSGIEDVKTNTTRFLVMGRQDLAPSGNDATSLLLSAAHKPGGLRAMLEPFETAGVSLPRIESRPNRSGLWEYVFFVDVAGHQEDTVLAPVLEQLRMELPLMRVLGSYPSGT